MAAAVKAVWDKTELAGAVMWWRPRDKVLSHEAIGGRISSDDTDDRSTRFSGSRRCLKAGITAAP